MYWTSCLLKKNAFKKEKKKKTLPNDGNWMIPSNVTLNIPGLSSSGIYRFSLFWIDV